MSMHRGLGTVRLLAAIVTVAFAIGAMLGPLCVLIGACSMPCCHAKTSPSASLATANSCGSSCNAQTAESQPAPSGVAPELKAPQAPLLIATATVAAHTLTTEDVRSASYPDAALPQSSPPRLYVLNSSFLI